tara:strand:+ start:61 stop:210 length:150 start_codon:yes stop_codon:yes gene_type:complete
VLDRGNGSTTNEDEGIILGRTSLYGTSEPVPVSSEKRKERDRPSHRLKK